jgi:F0F1-type ATP synthase assembly protein I
MISIVPLLAGLLLARFVTNRILVIAIETVLFALAAVVLILTAPDHGASHLAGAGLSAVLAPLCVLAVVLGLYWRSRAARGSTA